MTIYNARDDVVACELEDSFAILKLDTSEYFKLNSTGAVIWGRLADGASLEQLVESVCMNFDIGPDECRDDVAALVEELEGAGLVDRAD